MGRCPVGGDRGPHPSRRCAPPTPGSRRPAGPGARVTDRRGWRSWVPGVRCGARSAGRDQDAGYGHPAHARIWSAACGPRRGATVDGTSGTSGTSGTPGDAHGMAVDFPGWRRHAASSRRHVWTGGYPPPSACPRQSLPGNANARRPRVASLGVARSTMPAARCRDSTPQGSSVKALG